MGREINFSDARSSRGWVWLCLQRRVGESDGGSHSSVRRNRIREAEGLVQVLPVHTPHTHILHTHIYRLSYSTKPHDLPLIWTFPCFASNLTLIWVESAPLCVCCAGRYLNFQLNPETESAATDRQLRYLQIRHEVFANKVPYLLCKALLTLEFQEEMRCEDINCTV